MAIFLHILFMILSASTFAHSDYSGLQVKSHRRANGRITNGTFVLNISHFPYQVGIASYSLDNDRHWCGGSLISAQWILTAAHCLVGKEASDIYLGVIDRFMKPQFQVEQSNYIIHKNYGSHNKRNDIALIKLPVPVQLSSTINTIAIDKNPTVNNWVNRYALVSGWGSSVTGGLTNRKLQYAQVQILSNLNCLQTYGANFITPSHICQKVIENKGICKGDSGGPLVVNENGQFLLIGIVSFIKSGPRQCETDTPRVFTRVASFTQWICENTEKTVC